LDEVVSGRTNYGWSMLDSCGIDDVTLMNMWVEPWR